MRRSARESSHDASMGQANAASAVRKKSHHRTARAAFAHTGERGRGAGVGAATGGSLGSGPNGPLLAQGGNATRRSPRLDSGGPRAPSTSQHSRGGSVPVGGLLGDAHGGGGGSAPAKYINKEAGEMDVAEALASVPDEPALAQWPQQRLGGGDENDDGAGCFQPQQQRQQYEFLAE